MNKLGAHGAQRVDINVFLLQRGELLMQRVEFFEQSICGYSLPGKFLVECETLLP